MFEKPKIGQELLDVPMGEMIKEMALAIAEAQMLLDENSIDVAQMMGGLQTITDDDTGEVLFQDSRVFFGKEKLSTTDAVNLYNSSTDVAVKQSIEAELGSGAFSVFSDHIVVTTLVSRGTDPSVVYQVGSDYYVYTGSNTHKKVVYESIKKITVSASAPAFVLIPSRVSMLELGFSPTFYQFVDTIIEVKISIKYTQSGYKTTNTYTRNQDTIKTKQKNSLWRRLKFGKNKTKQKTISTSQVNGSYSQKFSYSAEGSSLLRTKLVPIPPPAILEERIRQQMELLSEGSLEEPVTID
jgi:hypothetical protein